MSESKNRAKKRRQKGRYLPRNRRFVRAESLEPRIVLDGSGLGVISPDYIPTIPINDDGLLSSISVEFVADNSVGKLNGNSGAGSGPNWILDFDRIFFAEVRDGLIIDSNSLTGLEPTDAFTRFSDGTELGLIGEGTVLAIPTPIVADIAGSLDIVDDRLTFRQEIYGETSFTVDQREIDAAFDSLHFNVGSEDFNPHLDGTESVSVKNNNTLLRGGAESRDLEVDLADRGAANRIEDPGLISLPDPAGGFLPVESSPAPPNVGSIAKTDSAGSEEASEHDDSEQLAATGPSGESTDSDRTVALSRDRYFASHQAREPVAWSTQSSASEVRQYVYPEPHDESYAGNQTPRVGAASDGSPSTFGFVTSVNTVSGASSPSGTTLDQLVVSTSAVSADAPELQHRTSDKQASVRPHRDWPLGESAASGPESSVSDLLIAKYEPLSVLVGVSLVSAHLIADSRVSPERVRKLVGQRQFVVLTNPKRKF